MNARWYSPALGRFLSADTVIPDEGDSQAWNRFAYVENRPINLWDPDGHRPSDGCEYEGCSTDKDPELFLQNYVRTLEASGSARAKFHLLFLEDTQHLAPDDISIEGIVVAAAQSANEYIASFTDDKGLVRLDVETGWQRQSCIMGDGSCDEFSLGTATAAAIYYKGLEKPWITGATPYSLYTQFRGAAPVQTALYNGSGDVIVHIDWKQHGAAPPGHWHHFPTPGDPSSGHGNGQPHYSPLKNSLWGLPDDWDDWP
jgi:hypothetical protein